MLDEIVKGDCLERLDAVDDDVADLIYVDPPFFTQKNHALKTRDRKTEYQFSDVWPSRIDYLDFLRTRIRKCWAKLKPTGSLFFHCDSSASHHIRCLLDEVFGESMFRAEIVWSYRRWANSQRAPLPSHQTIFFYSKTSDYQYNQIFEAYSPSTNVDQILQRRNRDADGKASYERSDDGEPVLDGDKRGVPLGDVWDIPLLNPKARERVGYPTQKPILLLERIIELATSPGDLVIDPFCGSGTTLVAAKLLGRRYIGMDVSGDAVELAATRIADPVRTSSALLQKGRDSYNQADKDALAFLHELGAVPVHRNKGVDAIVPTAPGEPPVLVRVQRRHESVLFAAEAIRAAGVSKQPAVLVLIVTDGRYRAGLFDEVPKEVNLVPSIGAALRVLLDKSGVSLASQSKLSSKRADETLSVVSGTVSARSQLSVQGTSSQQR